MTIDSASALFILGSVLDCNLATRSSNSRYYTWSSSSDCKVMFLSSFIIWSLSIAGAWHIEYYINKRWLRCPVMVIRNNPHHNKFIKCSKFKMKKGKKEKACSTRWKVIVLASCWSGFATLTCIDFISSTTPLLVIWLCEFNLQE